MAEKHITERKALPTEAGSKGRGACCNATAGDLGEKAPDPEARGKGRSECRYAAAGRCVDVAALDWDGWLAEKALQRAAWRARGG